MKEKGACVCYCVSELEGIVCVFMYGMHEARHAKLGVNVKEEGAFCVLMCVHVRVHACGWTCKTWS